MRLINKKRFSISIMVLAIIICGFVYLFFNSFKDKNIESEQSANAQSNDSVETSLLTKKIKNLNILEGYSTGDIVELNTSNLEQTGEKALTEEQYYRISGEDKQTLSTTSQKSSIYQRYKLKIDKDLTGKSTFQVQWQGISNRTVDMYGWDYARNSWVLLNYNLDRTDVNLTINADLDTNTMVKDSVANIIIGTAQKNSILKGKIPKKSDYDYTFAWLSDTQYYSASYPEIYNDITKYIADNQKDQKIIYAIHTGDLVDNMDDANQWKNADQSMKVLDKAGIPYGVLAGNHDVGHTAFNYSQFYEYFGEKRFKNKSSFGASPNNNRDHYDLVTAGQQDFIILYIGWGLNDSTYNWSNEVLKKYSDRKAIVCTHGYISGKGTYVEQGNAIYDKIITQNKNVFMVLSGHYGGAVINVKRSNDHVFYEMMANYQFNAEGGAGYFRLLHFDTKNNLIYVNTYSPYKNDYNFYDDVKEEFVIPINEETGEAELNTDTLVF